MSTYRSLFPLLYGLLWLPSHLFGQQELSLAFLPGQIQAQQIHPAAMQDQKIQIGLPSFYFNGLHNGFRVKDMIQPVAGTDSFRIDPAAAIAKMRDMSEIRLNGQVDLLSVGINHMGIQASVFATTRYQAYLGYPKTLFELAWNGNGAYLGETLDIAPDFSGRAWHEIGAGVSLPIGKRWRIGGRAKYLVGLADISVAERLLTLTTHEGHYAMNVEADYRLRTSILNFGNIEAPEFSLEPQAFTGNHGLGLDFGAQFQLNEKWTFLASVRDLGYIRWKDQAKGYQVKGSIYFDGLDVFQLYRDDSLSVEPLLDSLVGGIELTESDSSYTTTLPAQTNINVRYEALPWLSLGGMIQTETFQNRTRPTVALSATARVKNALRVGISYSMRQRRFDNLGLYGSLKLGPVVTFLASDNLLAFALPQGAQQTNIRMGMNIVFGKTKPPKAWR
ncbi:MAG: DUF5723 family protein [Bacteroidota bacterium]